MNIAIITAAGLGTRMHQEIPKQFLHVDDKPILIYTLEAFQKHPGIDSILVATIESWMDVVWAYAAQYKITKLKWVIKGGDSGQASIFNGLETLINDSYLDQEKSVVMIHDGNRPLVTSEIISDGLVTFAKHGNSVAVVPCTEVVFESDDGFGSCVSTPRERLFRTQTPHTYSLDELYRAHLQAMEKGIIDTAASCMLMQKLGNMSYFSKGSEENLKITTVDDLKIFKALLNARLDG